MKQSKRLLIVLRLAEQDEKKTAINFIASQKCLEDNQQQLKQSEGFLKEYQLQLHNNTRNSFSSFKWQTIRAFYNKLITMQIRQQQSIVEAIQVANVKRREWEGAHLRHKALRKLQAHYLHKENLILNKQEEKFIGDLMNRRFLAS